MLAFVLSGVLGGLAGALYAATYSVVTPDAFDINLSLMILTMLILGQTSIREVILFPLLKPELP